MNSQIHYITTATIKQSLCDDREAKRALRWSASMARWPDNAVTPVPPPGPESERPSANRGRLTTSMRQIP